MLLTPKQLQYILEIIAENNITDEFLILADFRGMYVQTDDGRHFDI